MVSKRHINNLYYLLIIALLLVLCSALRYGTQGIVIDWTENVRGKILLYHGPNLVLSPGEELQQTFTANYPGLNQVDILIQGGTTEQQLHFYLKTTCDTPESIRQITTVFSPQTEPVFHSFTFSPLDDSTNQSFCMVLQAGQSPISLPLSYGDLYPAGHLKVLRLVSKTVGSNTAAEPAQNLPYKIFLPAIQSNSHEELFEDAGFNLGYRGDAVSVALIFLGRLTAGKPYVWGQSWFYGLLIIVYVVLLIGLFLLVRQMGEAAE